MKAAAQIEIAANAQDVSACLAIAHEVLSQKNVTLPFQCAFILERACEGVLDRETWSDTLGKIWTRILDDMCKHCRSKAALAELDDTFRECLRACMLHGDANTARDVSNRPSPPVSWKLAHMTV
jgi:hypothetical protein